jgi:hypothetical protein
VFVVGASLNAIQLAVRLSIGVCVCNYRFMMMIDDEYCTSSYGSRSLKKNVTLKKRPSEMGHVEGISISIKCYAYVILLYVCFFLCCGECPPS